MRRSSCSSVIDVVAHLELERRDDADEVGVAAALAVAVDGALHVARAGVDRHEAAGDGAVAVVVRVHADDDVGQGRRDLADHVRDERRQAGPVGVAQADDRGARLGGRGRAAQRVGRVVAPGVEEVLGVVHHALALRGEEPDRLVDHAQVLVAAHVDDLAEVQAPGLADDGDRGREGVRQHAQAVVGLRGHALAPRHAEGDELRVAQPLVAHAPEELDLLRVGRGEPALDEADAELVELERDARLLVDRDREALLLHAVAQRGVVELYLTLGHRVLPVPPATCARTP